MTWWQQQQRQPRNPKTKTNPGQKNQQMAKEKGPSPFPPYDAGAIDKEPAGGSGSSASAPAAMDPQVFQVLKQLAVAHPSAAEQINGLLPDPDQQEIKDQQKKINVLRRLQQRVTKKEAQIKMKEQQMDQFIEQMKSHVVKEKLRHKEELEGLRKDIEQAKIDIQKIKDGDSTEPMAHADMELEELLEPGGPDPEKEKLKEKLEKAEQANYAMQQQLQQFQSQMTAFMQAQQAPSPSVAPPGLTFSPEQVVKPPVIQLDEAIAVARRDTRRDPLQPFGVRRSTQRSRTPSGTYTPSPGRPENGGRDTRQDKLEGMDN